MITSLEGVQGSSKSLTAVTLCFLEWFHNKKKIISNNHLNFPYTYFDTKYFVENVDSQELNDCVLYLDEAYLYLDGRNSQSKINKLFTYFVVQTRKRTVDLYICTHHIDIVDKRLRRAVDVRGTCNFYPEDPCRRCKCSRCGGEGKVMSEAGYVDDCPDCKGIGGTGKITSGKGVCPTCRGMGFIFDENYEPITCDACKGAKVGNTCPNCLGYGKSGISRTEFYNRKTMKTTSIKIHGPTYWGLYDTGELVPFMKKQMTIKMEDL